MILSRRDWRTGVTHVFVNELMTAEALLQRLLDHVGPEKLSHTIEQVAARAVDPYSAAEQLLS